MSAKCESPTRLAREFLRSVYHEVGGDPRKFTKKVRGKLGLTLDAALALYERTEEQEIDNGTAFPAIPPAIMQRLRPATPLATVSDGCVSRPPKKPAATTPPASSVSTTDADSGRDAKGRFGPGNKHGRGNPFARKLGAKRQAFIDAVSGDDVAAVAKKLRDQALQGDVAAASVFLSYCVGKPTAAVNPDRLDLDELDIVDRSPSKIEAVTMLIDLLDPAAVSDLIRDRLATRDPAKAMLDVMENVRDGCVATAAEADVVRKSRIKRK